MLTTLNRNTEFNAGVIPTSPNVHTKAPLEPTGEKRTQLEVILS